ncbi:MAG: cyclic nucleotide-binding domain-containing protein [Lachnospiraceae bacterium]|nr:cyclic nucleotide-binding domain-containing protein [Lachnospiraceae bacterium]
MASKINDRYIKEFFGLGDSPEDEEELAEIKKTLIKETYENGQDIITVDGDPDGMYFLESGTATVHGRDGSQLNILHVGQYFGEYAALTGQKRLSTVRSHGKTVVYKIGSEDVVRFLSKHPEIYGELMKRVYNQVSHKHAQILALSGNRKGVLSHPSNNLPITKKQVVIQYGLLIIFFLLTAFFIPTETSAPVFMVPLAFMLVWVLITKRTVESLVVSIMLAAILVYRGDFFSSFTDAFMDTMGAYDNVFTVLVMALMGGMVNLIVCTGGVTAFEKAAYKLGRSKRSIYLTSLGIMAATSIDDGLNMLCASYAAYTPAKEKGIVREKLALFFTMLPTVLSSFFPLSLWGIFVIGTLSATVKEETVGVFCRSIPFNFFSILTLIAMVLFAFGLFPKSKQIKDAEIRYEEEGTLWPAGSEKFLSVHETEIWGKILNVMLPILVLAASSLAVRSILNKSFVVDSAVGLVATLVFMFFMYCFRGISTPENFVENLIDGIASSALPCILYLLTTCFATQLSGLNLSIYFEDAIDIFDKIVFLLPVVVFICSQLLTMALGSSWAMYAIAFPIVLKLAVTLNLNPLIFIGAIAGAGIAGEKTCPFTAEAVNIANAVGISPEAAKKVRINYATVISVMASVFYLICGFFVRL